MNSTASKENAPVMKRNSVELVRAAAKETENEEAEVCVPYVPSTKVPKSRSVVVEKTFTARRTSHQPPFSKADSQEGVDMSEKVREVLQALVVMVRRASTTLLASRSSTTLPMARSAQQSLARRL